MDKETVLKLAKLARIEVADAEAESLSNELGSILKYVSDIKNAASTNNLQPTTNNRVNIMREDSNPHESGIYTKQILENAPSTEGDYITVKKIL